MFSPNENQEDIFSEVKELVKSALDGFKVCIFAYGQTGAGKTFTMEGDSINLGLVPRSVKMIFDYMSSYNRDEWEDIGVKMSCIEIHKENVRDLLNEENECANIMTNSLKFKQTEIEVRSFDDVEFLLERARSSRTTGSTAMNN